VAIEHSGDDRRYATVDQLGRRLRLNDASGTTEAFPRRAP
jgi:hypothetical protein